LSSRRKLLTILPENLVKKLIKEIASRYKERKGGYVRIIKIGPRKSDGAEMVIIELIKDYRLKKFIIEILRLLIYGT